MFTVVAVERAERIEFQNSLYKTSHSRPSRIIRKIRKVQCHTRMMSSDSTRTIRISLLYTVQKKIKMWMLATFILRKYSENSKKFSFFSL